MKRILITGGFGFIGSALARKLLSMNHDVEIFDHVSGPLMDVCNYPTFKQHIFSFKPTHVVHLGMVSKVTDAEKSPIYARESIVGGTANLLDILKDYDGLERLVFASSSTVYGDFIPELSPPTEDHPTNPINLYGALKLCSETLIKTYNSVYGLEYTIVRPSSVYGPFDYNLRVIGRFFLDAITNGIITVNGQNTQVDFSYIDDVVDGFVSAIFNPKARNQIFNITRGQTRTLLEAAEMVEQIIPNTKIEVRNKNILFPNRGAFDISKARKLLDYDPQVDLQEGIEKYAKHMFASWQSYIK